MNTLMPDGDVCWKCGGRAGEPRCDACGGVGRTPAGLYRTGVHASVLGRRVRLIRCTDEWTRLEPGAEGTVRHVDAIGTLHVNWDNGARLGLVPGEDEWEWLP